MAERRVLDVKPDTERWRRHHVRFWFWIIAGVVVLVIDRLLAASDLRLVHELFLNGMWWVCWCFAAWHKGWMARDGEDGDG